MHTPICDLFGIEYPIFAFSHCRDVVAAVSRAGGLGVLGAVGFSAEQLDIELSWIDEHVDGMPYGVDTVMPAKSVDTGGGGDDPDDLAARIRTMIPSEHWEYVDELMDRFDIPPLPDDVEPHGVVGWAEGVARAHVEIALAHPIALLANALGSPPPDVVDQAHDHGVKVAALAGKAQHAERHVNNGVDVIVAQGHEAGGHTGEVTTMVLVPEVVDACEGTPVLAAGGIGRGRQVAAAMSLGAQGAWTGSLWLASAESNSGPETIDRYLAATSSDTVRTRCFTGKPARALRNTWTEAWEDPSGPGPLGMPLQNILTAEANARINRTHRSDLGFVPVGQIVGSMNKVKSVRDLMFEMVEEYIETVERMHSGMTAPT
ncbi:nitronate monooxygenase family protein [Acidimicrobiia bacterium EGI L10123]|uniref:NAD(P)H-dependent flavin oxidoreductase n=1 Tax=Salinilacustrithrix flava TaxID=2957203 RepID=UPI003D7C2931|nr:nitronate monooxygenase family protein [Acidimicrobiia bacterium EGI L10123]